MYITNLGVNPLTIRIRIIVMAQLIFQCTIKSCIQLSAITVTLQSSRRTTRWKRLVELLQENNTIVGRKGLSHTCIGLSDLHSFLFPEGHESHYYTGSQTLESAQHPLYKKHWQWTLNLSSCAATFFVKFWYNAQRSMLRYTSNLQESYFRNKYIQVDGMPH